MVVGLGIDVASIERIRVALTRFGDRLWQRILTKNEQADLAARPDRALALAGRFAAKEAAVKALGGQPDVWWHDVEIRPDPRGAPGLAFLGPAHVHAERLGVSRIWVSISHDAGVATAVVVLDGK